MRVGDRVSAPADLLAKARERRRGSIRSIDLTAKGAWINFDGDGPGDETFVSFSRLRVLDAVSALADLA